MASKLTGNNASRISSASGRQVRAESQWDALRRRYNVRRFYLFVDPPTYSRHCQFLFHPVSSGVLELTRMPPQSSCPASPSLSAAHSPYIHRKTQLYTGNRDPARPRSRFRPTHRHTSCAHVRALLLLPSPGAVVPTTPHTRARSASFACCPSSPASIRSEASPYRYASTLIPAPTYTPPAPPGDYEVCLIPASVRIRVRTHEPRAGREVTEGKRMSPIKRLCVFPASASSTHSMSASAPPLCLAGCSVVAVSDSGPAPSARLIRLLWGADAVMRGKGGGR
ncbi:hypothetical protein B0H14DRAFT_1706879 [Mycena olivaceomarginata]|nr:hypothetical protein B0H14DRAFT_1706879 [Mycena olivaceomarginata]